jgi:hypothetical protein
VISVKFRRFSKSRSAAVQPSLFVTEGHDGVDGKCAACGSVAGGEGGESEKGRDHEISHRIAGVDAEEQTGHCTAGQECDCRTEGAG